MLELINEEQTDSPIACKVGIHDFYLANISINNVSS